MKNIIYKLTLIAFIISLLFSSCESFIDLQPLDEISSVDYWKTSSDLENYVLQFYPTLGSSIMIWEEENSDNILTPTPNAVMNGERTLRTGNWRGEWNNIRKINIFFDNYQKCENDFDTYKHFLGEAYFFRAWYYFDMLVRYGDLPWYGTAINPDQEELLMLPRAPRTMVADSILADLDKAFQYLNLREQAGNNRINKEAALAFKSRVALFEGSWQKYHATTLFGTEGANPNKYFLQCVNAAEELINGNYNVGIYNTGEPSQDYYQLFGFDDMSDINEVILYRAFNESEGLINKTQYRAVNYPEGRSATWELVTSYLGLDGKPYNFLETSQTSKGNDFLTKISEECDPRLKSTIWIPGDLMAAVADHIEYTYPDIDAGALQLCPTGFEIKKSSNPYSPAAGRAFEGNSETGYIYFRYGELLLNYAEAKYELDNTVAYPQLNLLRQRAGMPDFEVISQASYENPLNYGYTISDELYEIRRERRIELALEGYRSMDYMRWRAHALFKSKRLKGYPFNAEEFPNFEPSVDENGLIDYLSSQLPNGYQFRENQDYLLSIPQDELTLNPNLDQNPNW